MNQERQSKIRLGIIGLGGRGHGQLTEILEMEDVEVSAVCDLYADRMQTAAELVVHAGRMKPACYMDYKELLARADLDAVIIISSWTTHSEIAVAAMKSGKYVATEVGGASSIEECWQLVRASEETGIPLMMLENCCYGREEMALMNMVGKGVFGELIHCQCGYEHDLREEVAMGIENRHYRIHNYLKRNGDMYPTHGLGPVAKWLGINRGNRFLSLTSMASKSRGINQWAGEQLGKEHPFATAAFALGDVVTTMIKCANGETILLTHDTSLPRPYSRGGRIQGTKGIWMEDTKSIYMDGQSPFHTWEPFDSYREEYDHPLWKEYQQLGVRGNHDGMDYLTLRAFVESVKEKTYPPIDVYDTAAWMVVTALSEQSIALGGQPVIFPDFTNGKWIQTAPKAFGKYSLDVVIE